jgi:hypothetical protein
LTDPFSAYQKGPWHDPVPPAEPPPVTLTCQECKGKVIQTTPRDETERRWVHQDDVLVVSGGKAHKQYADHVPVLNIIDTTATEEK